MPPIAPATYYDHLAKRTDPARLSGRAKRDAALRTKIQRVFDANWQVYGMRKIWRRFETDGERVGSECHAFGPATRHQRGT